MKLSPNSADFPTEKNVKSYFMALTLMLKNLMQVIVVNVVIRKHYSTFLRVVIIYHKKIFYLIKKMKFSQVKPISPQSKNVQSYFMALTFMLKNLTVVIYLLSIKCRHTLLQLNVVFKLKSPKD